MSQNVTGEHLGDDAARRRARLTVTNFSSFSGGWCLFLDGEGRGAVVLISLPVAGRGPDLTERRFSLALTEGKAQAMFARCIEHDVASVTLDAPGGAPARPRLPDEPWVEITLRNASRKQLSVGKPIGIEQPALDAVMRAAHALTRTVHKATPDYEGPWRSSWTPWKALDAAG